MNVLTRKIPDYYYEKSNLIRLDIIHGFFWSNLYQYLQAFQFFDLVSGIGI